MDPEKLGPFTIGRALGRGGMGAVYRGTSETDGSTVALKVLTDSLDDDEEVRLRFESEIETLKRLHHPNIVRLSGFGEEQGRLYYVREFVDGSTLQQELRKKRLFLWHEAAKIGHDISQALRHAHDRGVIHRDIKPANILLNQDGEVKLSDFGIARFFGSRQITDAHSIVGTLEYMSPEQAQANPICSSSDLYSLGCVLYALLTGKPPFPARTLPELLRKHKSVAPAPIRSIRHDVPDDLENIVLELLHIRPEDRPRNAPLVVKRLQSLLHAFMEDPSAIKVFPMSSDTPKQLHESPVPFIPPPSNETEQSQGESLSGLFRRIGEEYFIDESHTAALSSDANTPEDSRRVMLLANTVTSLSTPHHGEFLPENKPLLRPTKDDPLPDPAVHWSKSPLIKPKMAVPQDNALDLPEGKPTNRKREIPPQLTKSATRFVAVANKQFDPFEEERQTRPLFSLTTILTSTTLMIVGLIVYYLVQPVPPDVLYSRIVATIREDESAEELSPALLRSAQNDIKKFLERYDDHRSAEQVRIYQDELDLLEHERRLERRMQFSSLRSLSPVERAYVNVLTGSPHDPEQMIDQLRAFIAVFQSSVELAHSQRPTSSLAEICVELARRRLKKLEQTVDAISAEQEAVLRYRLDDAEALDSTNPARAKDIRRGIIELYQNQHWAKELVDEAKQRLEE
jgi:serine/threonine-protein kinase